MVPNSCMRKTTADSCIVFNNYFWHMSLEKDQLQVDMKLADKIKLTGFSSQYTTLQVLQ